jgi:hypothetical protein
MGGNALKVPTRRYEKDEYEKIASDVLRMLSNYDIVAVIPESYSNKDTFGDLDVLIKSSTVKTDIMEIIEYLFNPNEIYNNNNVKSFDYKEFQIDFILVGDENWNSSINYFSYNDLGNFIGRISYQMGFRFGDYGLKLVYRHEDGGRKFSKIISKDAAKIYEFLGFDYSRYLEGFDDVEDIFAYVVSSKYFNPRIFDYEQLNHQNRTRNKKRKNYELFLQYVKDNPKGNEMTISAADGTGTPIKSFLHETYVFGSKDGFVDEAEKFFNTEIRSEIDAWKEIVDQQKRASGIFNGNVVMERYPLRGKELGAAMKKFNDYFNTFLPDATDDNKKLYRSRWILDNNLETIFEVFSRVNNLD